MQSTLICLVHVSCHKPCSRSAEYYHLLISSFPPFFFGKNFSFFFSTALTSWRFCISFNWLRQLLQSLELYSASNLGLVAKALSRCYQQFQARCVQVSMNLSILKIHKRLPCFVYCGIFINGLHFSVHAKRINNSRKLYSYEAHNNAQNAPELYPF